MFRQGFSCPALLVVCSVPQPVFVYGAITHYVPDFSISVPLTS